MGKKLLQVVCAALGIAILSMYLWHKSTTEQEVDDTYPVDVSSLKFGIGSDTKDIVDEWGMPEAVEYFIGGLYFRYPDKGVVFFTDAYREKSEIVHGKVKMLTVFDDQTSIYGIRVGMTFSEIKAIHGEPKMYNMPSDNDANELFQGEWTVVYHFENYEVVFSAKSEGGVVSALTISELK